MKKTIHGLLFECLKIKKNLNLIYLKNPIIKYLFLNIEVLGKKLKLGII